jgi:hypothetical protein
MAAEMVIRPIRTCGFACSSHCASEVGAARIQRIYAALPQRHNELREIFRQAGFIGYAQQSVLRLDGPDWDQGTTLAPMRPQSNHDVWAIHKLYGAVTPRQVQLFEARDARSWMLPLDRVWRRPYRNAWVLGAGDRMVAYLHRTTGPVGHVFSLLIRPDAREQMTDVLRFGLAQIHDALPVYLILRDYQQELFPSGGRSRLSSRCRSHVALQTDDRCSATFPADPRA